MSRKTTDISHLLGDLNAGVFAQKVGAAMSDVALAVVTEGRSGSVSLKFNFKRIGESTQVACTHSLTLSRPTRRGKLSEEDSTETPLHVGVNGRLTLFPEQEDLVDKISESSEAQRA